MTRHNDGFTLIELVVVIVILGILAVTAVPKFIDLSQEAEDAALRGVKGGIESASAVNYGGRKANDPDATATFGGGLTCTDAVGRVMEGGVPTGYTVSGAAMVAGRNNCVVTQTSTSNTLSAVVIGVN